MLLTLEIVNTCLLAVVVWAVLRDEFAQAINQLFPTKAEALVYPSPTPSTPAPKPPSHGLRAMQVVTYPHLHVVGWVRENSPAHKNALETPGLAVRESQNHPVDPGVQ